jgi:hypothetical protein
MVTARTRAIRHCSSHAGHFHNMNKAKLKSYAPQARKDFIAAVTARANLLGLSDHGGKLEVAAGRAQGDVTVIAGRAWPAKVASSASA